MADTSNDNGLAEVKDKLEIMELAARYNEASINFDADAYVDCYTEDGVYVHVPGGPWTEGLRSEGREALLAQVKGAEEYGEGIPRGMFHMTSDFRIEIDGDTATSACQMVIYGRFKPGEPNRIEACGTYQDKLRRTEQGWRFSERISTLWHEND